MAPPRYTDLLKRYVSEIKRSSRWRENEGYDDLWKRMRDLYRGKHLKTTSTSDQLVVNMSFATINVIAPSVAVNNPKFTVMARRPEYEVQAMFAEEALNYQWRTNRYQDQFRLCVTDWLDFGHGWMKVGYKFVTEPKVVRSDEGDDPYAVDTEGVDDREPIEGNVESERNIIEDRPYAERISPWDMFIDPDGKTLDVVRWVAQRIRRPVADVRVDSRYSPKYRKEVQPSMTSRWEQGSGSQPDPTGLESRDNGFVDVIEFYDMRRKTMSTFCENCEDGFLINPIPMPYAFGPPFLMLRNYEVPDEFYPMGELESIETLQNELNETRSQMVNHRKKYARKYLYLEDAFDDVGISALTAEDDNTMVPVNAGQDVNRVIIPMPTVGTPPDFYNQSEMIQSDIDRVSGVSDYMRGDMPDIRRTATEAAMVQDAQQSRAADKLSKVEVFLSRLGERIIQLMQQYMTGEQVVRVMGSNAAPVWLNFDRDYIQGQFDFEVEAGSTEPQNETFRRQAALQMVDAMAPLVQAGVVNPSAVARRVLQFGFGVKDPNLFLQEAPPPEGAPGSAPPGGQGAPAPGPSPGGAPGIPAGPGQPPPEQAPLEQASQAAAGQPPQPELSPAQIEQLLTEIPPQVLQQLMAMPPDQVTELVRAGQLPPEIIDVLSFVQQQEQQMGAAPPGGPPVAGP